MNRITSLQLLSLMLLSSVWELVCLRQIPGSGAILGAICAYLLQFALLIPLLSTDITPVQSRAAGIAYAAYFLLAGARNLSQLSHAAPQSLLSVPGKLAGLVLLFVTCLYTAASGIRAAARCAPMTLGVLALATVVLIAGAWGRTVPERFYWSQEGFSEGMGVFFTASELPALWVLRGRLRGSPRRMLMRYTLLRAGVTALLIYLSIAADGRLLGLRDYPFFTLTALSQPLAGQRADALYILVFVMLCVMQLTLQAGLCAHVLEEAFAFRRHTAPAVLLGMLLLAGVMPPDMLTALTGMLTPILAFGLPCTILLLRRMGRRVRV